MTAVLIVLGLIAIVVGILGTIYPALPGLGLMFGGAWLLGYAGDYQVFGSGTLTFFGYRCRIRYCNGLCGGRIGCKIYRSKQNRSLGCIYRRHRRRILLYSRLVARPVDRRGHRRIYCTQRHLAGRQSRYRYVYRLYHRHCGQNRLRIDHRTDHPVCLVSLILLNKKY